MSKDWVGGSSILKTVGSSVGAKNEREENDFYATDPIALEKFLDTLKEEGKKLPNNIFEPSCGQGHLSKVLLKRGYNVMSSDLIDRGFGEYSGIDFLKDDLSFAKDYFDCVLTNPPYKYALEFVKKGLEITNRFCIMFLKLTFLEGKERYKFFQEHPPRYVYVHSSRVGCQLGGGEFKTHGGACCYAWFVFLKGYKGDTIIKWIE